MNYGWGSGFGGRGVGVVVDGDTEIAGQTGESVVVALTDGTDLPAVVAAVDFDGDGRGFAAPVVDGECGECATVCVANGDVCLSQVRESCRGRCVETEDDCDALDLLIEAVQVHGDSVLHEGSGTSFASVMSGIVSGFGLVVEHEIEVTAHLPVMGEQERGQVGVDLGVLVPCAAHRDGGLIEWGILSLSSTARAALPGRTC